MRLRMTEAQRAATPAHDFRPFSGDPHARNLIRRFVEAGVAGYNIEDQRSGTKVAVKVKLSAQILWSCGKEYGRNARFEKRLFAARPATVRRPNPGYLAYRGHRSYFKSQGRVINSRRVNP
jgi:hypothetical protein